MLYSSKSPEKPKLKVVETRLIPTERRENVAPQTLYVKFNDGRMFVVEFGSIPGIEINGISSPEYVCRAGFVNGDKRFVLGVEVDLSRRCRSNFVISGKELQKREFIKYVIAFLEHARSGMKGVSASAFLNFGSVPSMLKVLAQQEEF